VLHLEIEGLVRFDWRFLCCDGTAEPAEQTANISVSYRSCAQLQ
jgi:hypothetical protein